MRSSGTSHLGDHLRDYLDKRHTDGGRQPNIVLFGNYGQGNLGDEAILHAILTVVGERARITVISRAPRRVQVLHGASAASMFGWSGITALLRADIIAIGGGGIFGNNMAPMPKLLAVLALVMQLLGKEVAFVAIGAYTTTPGWIQAVLRRVARRASFVTVRDEESAGVLSAANSILVSDPGMSIEPAPPQDALDYLSSRGITTRDVLGISVKPAADNALDDRQIAIATAAVDFWRRRHPTGTVLLLCLSERGNSGHGLRRTDEMMSRAIAAQSGHPTFCHVVPSTVTPWLMKAVIGQCTVVLAHRLHAQMFAYSQGVPVIGMSWERKSDVFLDTVGVPRIDLAEPVDVAAAVRCIADAVQVPEVVRNEPTMTRAGD